jgi:hypothetical protein
VNLPNICSQLQVQLSAAQTGLYTSQYQANLALVAWTSASDLLISLQAANPPDPMAIRNQQSIVNTLKGQMDTLDASVALWQSIIATIQKQLIANNCGDGSGS